MKLLKSNQKISKSNVSPYSEKFQFVFRYPVLCLVLLASLVYLKTINSGFIHFDDSLFIEESRIFNQDPGNVVPAFTRGLFGNSDNTYYRPLFLADIILEYQLFGTKPAGYHFTNLLFHLASVILLYFFLRKLLSDDKSALLLSALFAVHPVLSQGIAWIAGRNDMLLFIFCISGMILSLDYASSGNVRFLVFQFLLFLLALFTKETAVLIPVITIALLFLVRKTEWKRTVPLVISWAIAIAGWYLLRSHALAGRTNTSFSESISTAIGRAPAFVQYFEKRSFPLT